MFENWKLQAFDTQLQRLEKPLQYSDDGFQIDSIQTA
jgi:hypothetical protein